MKLLPRIAAIGAAAGIAISTAITPAQAFDFESLSSTNKPLSAQYDWVNCDFLGGALRVTGLLKPGQYNSELARDIAQWGKWQLSEQHPALAVWNAAQAAAIADRAQKCGLVKPDTYISVLSSNLSS